MKDWLKGTALAVLICTAPDGAKSFDALLDEAVLPQEIMTGWTLYSGKTTEECWHMKAEFTARSMCWVAAMNDRQEPVGSLEALAFVYRKVLVIGYSADMEDWSEGRYADAIVELNSVVVRFLNDAYTVSLAFERPLTFEELTSLFEARVTMNRLLPGG